MKRFIALAVTIVYVLNCSFSAFAMESTNQKSAEIIQDVESENTKSTSNDEITENDSSIITSKNQSNSAKEGVDPNDEVSKDEMPQSDKIEADESYTDNDERHDLEDNLITEKETLDNNGDATDNIQQDTLVEYLYIDNPELGLTEKQNIVVGLNENIDAEHVRLGYLNNEGIEKYFDLSIQVDNVLLFTPVFDEQSDLGRYEIKSLLYDWNGKSYRVDFAETAGFNVIDNTEKKFVEETKVTVADENITSDDIGNAIEGAQSIALEEGVELSVMRNYARSANGKIVVVIDPGHDATHAGTRYGGLEEEELTLKIAKYAQEELQQYKGVEVYLTRDGMECPFGGTSVHCNRSRVDYAASVGADLYVSIHINSTAGGATSANGAEAYVSNYSPYTESSTELANKVLSGLEKVGLHNRGVKINADDKDHGKYDDGNWQDDFTVMKNSVLSGFPPILIEHAFVNNDHDHNILSNESKLNQMGIADATAVADYFQLKKSIVSEEQKKLIRDFVVRMYRYGLGREPEAEGLDFWSERFINGEATSAEIVSGMILGDEFANRNLSDQQFVNVLYKVFMDRDADSSGRQYWLNAMSSGVTRRGVCLGLFNSGEFTNICKQYGIEKGSIAYTEARDINASITMFVDRCYQEILGRKPDVAGLNFQCNVLASKQATGAGLLNDFFSSTEYVKKNSSNTEYIKTLYKACMDRNYDTSGLNYWNNMLNNGLTRKFIRAQFVNSEEFTKICSSYGISKGAIALAEAREKNANVTMYVYRCYDKALGRVPEVSGLNYWAQIINSKTQTAEQVAKGFIFSEEFKNKMYSNEDYIKLLYRVFMDREYDSSGLKYWKNKLDSGTSREIVFYGFSRSPEYTKILQSYGL